MKTTLLTVFACLVPLALLRAELQQVDKVDSQPLLLQVKSLLEALDYLGEPLPAIAPVRVPVFFRSLFRRTLTFGEISENV